MDPGLGITGFLKVGWRAGLGCTEATEFGVKIYLDSLTRVKSEHRYMHETGGFNCWLGQKVHHLGDTGELCQGGRGKIGRETFPRFFPYRFDFLSH